MKKNKNIGIIIFIILVLLALVRCFVPERKSEVTVQDTGDGLYFVKYKDKVLLSIKGIDVITKHGRSSLLYVNGYSGMDQMYTVKINRDESKVEKFVVFEGDMIGVWESKSGEYQIVNIKDAGVNEYLEEQY